MKLQNVKQTDSLTGGTYLGVSPTGEVVRQTSRNAWYTGGFLSDIDLDDVTEPGRYKLYGTCSGGPEGISLQGAVLEVDLWDGNRQYHRLTAISGTTPVVFVRFHTSSGWYPWYTLSLTEQSGGNSHTISALQFGAERRAA